MTRLFGDMPPDLSRHLLEVRALSPSAVWIALTRGSWDATGEEAPMVPFRHGVSPVQPRAEEQELACTDFPAPLVWNPCWNWADVEEDGTEDLGPAASGEPRGQYLCETCFDAMTDDICPAAASPTGLEQAECAACAARRRHPGTEG